MKEQKRGVVWVERNADPFSMIRSKGFDNIEEASDDSSQDDKSDLKSVSKLSKSQLGDPHIKFYIHKNKNKKNDKHKGMKFIKNWDW